MAEHNDVPSAPEHDADAQQLTAEHAEESDEIEEYQARLSPKAQRAWQIALGWIFGFAVWFFLALSAYFPDNVIMSWLFLIIFVGAMIVRRQVEMRTGVSMRTFMNQLLISLIVFLALYVVLGPVTGVLDPERVVG